MTTAKKHFQSVDEYLASQPENTRAALERVRRAIKKAVPGGEEIISYNMPAYKMPSGAKLFFAGWKKHYSLYPAPKGLESELAAYEIEKGTIRFPLSEPVPVTLIERIAKMREMQGEPASESSARKR